jgi:hypothetical protein
VSRLHDPAISVLYLFSVEALPLRGADALCGPWEALGQLILEREVDEPACRRYMGHAKDGTPCQLAWSLAHDTHLVRLTLSQPGAGTPAAWAELRGLHDKLIAEVSKRPGQPRPWGVTYLYHAILPPGVQTAEAEACVTDPSGLALDPDNAGLADATPYGWLWGVLEGEKPVIAEDGAACWQRTLALLTPQERAERTLTFFLAPLTQGFARIELYLHKGRHHAQQHEAIRGTLERSGAELQDGMLVALRTADFNQLLREQLELEEISQRLMRFLAQKTQAEILLNSLRANLQALTEHLERVRLEAHVYSGQAAYLTRHIEQLESDLSNARVVSESTYAFQDIHRQVGTSRLERASVLLGGAAAVLAGVAIFNSFLDIWNLAVEGSGLARPSPWLRAVLGAVAAIAWPLGAYWAVERRKTRAALAFVVGVLAVALAVISTWLVNP